MEVTYDPRYYERDMLNTDAKVISAFLMALWKGRHSCSTVMWYIQHGYFLSVNTNDVLCASRLYKGLLPTASNCCIVTINRFTKAACPCLGFMGSLAFLVRYALKRTRHKGTRVEIRLWQNPAPLLQPGIDSGAATCPACANRGSRRPLC